MVRVLGLIAFLAIAVGGAVATRVSVAPLSPAQALDAHLDAFERSETARLSAGEPRPVRVSAVLDMIETRDGPDAESDPAHPLRAIVHLKRDGKPYDRPCLLYNRNTRAWAWEADDAPANQP